MSAQTEARLEGIPFVVSEIRKSFSKLVLKTGGVDSTIKNLIVDEELRFVVWMTNNDAHRDAESSPRSLEHWSRSRPQSYGVLSYSLLNVNRLLECIDRLLEERLGPDQKAVLDLFTKQLRDALKTVEDVTADR
ncbi:hypothetical protein CEP54_005817 [Fusarium duplospermum]|uniref:Uncharacterized protein n=1 Tax=Fusarium duplospermum TaxID=1325734 RepID=A0A428QAC8_9HYPO|nr:hypothetical protein CEP54_005817 [Fusarium duplospermum]